MSDLIVMVQAFAELRYGVVAHTLENSVKYGHNLGHTPYYPLQSHSQILVLLYRIRRLSRRRWSDTCTRDLTFKLASHGETDAFPQF